MIKKSSFKSLSANGKHLYVIYLLDEGRKAWIRWLEFKCWERSLLWYFTFIVEGSYLVSFLIYTALGWWRTVLSIYLFFF